MEETPGEKPKLHIDEDWKSQAQAEKERLEREQASRAEARPESGAEPAESKPAASEPKAAESKQPASKPAEAKPEEHARRLPPPSFVMLITTLATQSMMLLGQIPDPMSGKAEVDLPQAQHFIDTLAMLDEKTAGNRTPDESRLLDNLLHELRMVYVQVSAGSHSAS